MGDQYFAFEVLLPDNSLQPWLAFTFWLNTGIHSSNEEGFILNCKELTTFVLSLLSFFSKRAQSNQLPSACAVPEQCLSALPYITISISAISLAKQLVCFCGAKTLRKQWDKKDVTLRSSSLIS